MPTQLTDPLVLASVAAGVVGLVLLVQARLQSRLMRGRVAAGASSIVVDPATGLFSPAAAWQCIRAEANRAARLSRPLQVWVAAAEDGAELDRHGRELTFEMPAGATGIRVGHRHLCVVSCAGEDASPVQLVDELDWSARSIEPGEHAASTALAFVSEATGAGA
jgi:hypothetical protein